MDQVDQYNWSVIYTDHKKEFIHLKHLESSNPNAQIILADTSNKFPKEFAWRNGDLLLREWLKQNHTKIVYDNIAVLEWDVLVNIKLPSIHINGLIGKNKIFYPSNWHWFREKHSLGKYEKFTIGIAPFGVLFMNKNCINTLIDQEFDEIYSKDIQAELRLPTILSSRQISITSFSMPNVSFLPVNFTDAKSIYHPIKKEITEA